MFSCNWRELLQHLGFQCLNVYWCIFHPCVRLLHDLCCKKKKGDGEAEEIFICDY